MAKFGWMLLGIFLGAAMAPGLTLLSDWTWWPHVARTVGYVHPEAGVVKVFAKGGLPLPDIWMGESSVSDHAVTKGSGKRRERIVIGLGHRAPGSGHVKIFSRWGNEVFDIPTYDCEIADQYRAREYDVSDCFSVKDLSSLEAFDSESNSVLVVSGDPTWSLCRVLKIDVQTGDIVGDYWHTGQLSEPSIGDADCDGRPELLFRGTNNRLTESVGRLAYKSYDKKSDAHVPVALCLDSTDLSGQSHPCVLPSVEQGTPLWYLAFPPRHGPLDGIRMEDCDGDGDLEYILSMSNGIMYRVAPRPNHSVDVQVAPGDDWLRKHPLTTPPEMYLVRGTINRGFTLTQLVPQRLSGGGFVYEEAQLVWAEEAPD